MRRSPSPFTVAGVVLGLLIAAVAVAASACTSKPPNGSFGCTWVTTDQQPAPVVKQ
jgi:hypothetical protein